MRCGDCVWRLMTQCWEARAGERPTFAALKMELHDAYGAEMAALAAQERERHEREQALCVVCMDAPADFALLPCGHKCVCERDAHAMLARGSCPLCREPARASQRIY